MKNKLFLLFIAIIGGICAAQGYFTWHLWTENKILNSESSSSQQSSVTHNIPLGNQEQLIVDAVAKADPAVVSVIITKDLPKMKQVFEDALPFGGGFFGFDPFFDQFRMRIPKLEQDGTEKKEIGGGTAFLISNNGLLLTNKHVVSDDKAEYTVLLNDGTKIPAVVIGRDPSNDIALIKIERKNTPSLELARDEDIRLAQTAIAIGNALGEFRNTVSVGIVSGLQRSIVAGDRSTGATEDLQQIIQTDAAINQGNSGGPLLNSDGKVIGMNTAVSSVGQNIGFAIPARDLRRVVESYQKHGRIVRTYLGIRYIPITKELQEKNKLSTDTGVLVARGETTADLAVMPGSPADKAGIVENDIIVEVDGKKLSSDVSLSRIVQAKQPGDTLSVTLLHKGEEKKLTILLEELKE